MIESPLTIISHYPGKIRIVPAEASSNISKSCTLRTKFDIATHATDQRKFQITLEVSFGKVPKGATPEAFRGEVEMIGYFQIHPNYSEDKIDALISITGTSILYGAARELICTLTSRHPAGTLSIPSVSFMDTPAKKRKQKKHLT